MSNQHQALRKSKIWYDLVYKKEQQKIIRKYKVCQNCGSWKRLTIHHIIPISKRPDLMLERSNIKVLCFVCHSKEHKKR